MMLKGVFFRGETAIIYATTFTGHPSSPTDPDSVTISVYFYVIKNGPEIENADMAKDSTGHYHYDIDTTQITEVGKCKIIIKAVTDGRTSIGRGSFVLSEQVM